MAGVSRTKDRAMQVELTGEGALQHLDALYFTPSGASVYFPVYAMKASALSELEQMPSHEDMMSQGLVEWKEDLGPLVFISHQWTSIHSGPDPTRAQWQLLQYLAANLQDLHDLSDKEQEEEAPMDSAYIWLDYWSIPQIDKKGQLRAIHSIPAYAEYSLCMCVIAPRTLHFELGHVCDLESWRQRGWCRLESLAFLLKEYSINVRRRIYYITGAQGTMQSKNAGLLLSPYVSVFNGNFTCCHMNHQDKNGNIIPCDKVSLVSVVRAFFFAACERTVGDVRTYRKLAVSDWLLYDGLHSVTRRPPSIAEFLARLYIPDVLAELEGGMSALHYAAMANDVRLVADLVLAKADIHRAEPDLGLTPLFSAILCEAVSTVKLLIELNASLRIDPEFSALALASDVGRPRCVAELLPLIDLEERVHAYCTISHVREGTPLFLAARKGNLEVVIQLLEARADIHVKAGPSSPHAGLGVLDIAKERGHSDVVEALTGAPPKMS